MNWETIKEKYPKTIEIFMNWWMRNNAFKDLEKRFVVTKYGFAIESLKTVSKFKGNETCKRWTCYTRHDNDNGNRFLYDFFDGERISIEVSWYHSDNPTIGIIWDADITDFNCPAQIYEVVDNCDSRTEAEEQAFLKAFEILENKLEEK